MAVGLTLALGWPLDPWPWLYPLYYLALLLPRQVDDDRRCARKYGALWAEYCRRVPRWCQTLPGPVLPPRNRPVTPSKGRI